MFARTPRLTLRPAWPEDAEALHEAMAHENVVTRLSRVPWPYRVEDARDWLARKTGGPDDVFCLILAHDGGAQPRLIGGIGLHPARDGGPQEHAHELGYWLTPSAWGRGYATEAGGAVIGMARDTLRLKRLSSTHFLDNPASGRVMRKLGFRPTGRVIAQPCLARGHEVQAAVYELDLEDCAEERMAA